MTTSTDRPVLITDAVVSYEDQFAARKRRYALLMGGRVVLMAAAAAAYPVAVWLAVTLLALSIPLPWMAVLIANDGPAHKAENAHRLGAPTPVRQLETGSHVVIEASDPERDRDAA